MIRSSLFDATYHSLKRTPARYTTISLIFCSSLILAMCAQISIPLYFSPIPLSGQTWGAMLIGGLLGSRNGSLAVILYLIEGAMGLPFFAGGTSGLLPLIGTNGGYCLGFVAQAFLTGLVLESTKKPSWIRLIGVLSTACLIQLSLGALWLSRFVGPSLALPLGVYPFLLGEGIKILSLALVLKSLL